MEVKVLDDADAVAREGAAVIAVEARAAVAARGRFIVAVSGGHTPWHRKTYRGRAFTWRR